MHERGGEGKAKEEKGGGALSHLIVQYFYFHGISFDVVLYRMGGGGLLRRRRGGEEKR